MAIDVKTAIEKGDVATLSQLLRQEPARANELIRWGGKNTCLTHPLHFVSDMLFEHKLAKGMELPLIDALIEAGADLNFQRDREDGKKSDTPLIGAASLTGRRCWVRIGLRRG